MHHSKKMISLIFHHSMASDEAYFIAEMARGVDGPVAIKVSEPVLTVDTDVDEQFINNGFKSITDILNQVPAPSTPESLLFRAGRAGEVLRVLSHVSDPLREEEITLDLDITTRELLASTMLESLQLADVMFTKAADLERSSLKSWFFWLGSFNLTLVSL